MVLLAVVVAVVVVVVRSCLMCGGGCGVGCGVMVILCDGCGVVWSLAVMVAVCEWSWWCWCSDCGIAWRCLVVVVRVWWRRVAGRPTLLRQPLVTLTPGLGELDR